MALKVRSKLSITHRVFIVINHVLRIFLVSDGSDCDLQWSIIVILALLHIDSILSIVSLDRELAQII